MGGEAKETYAHRATDSHAHVLHAANAGRKGAPGALSSAFFGAGPGVAIEAIPLYLNGIPQKMRSSHGYRC
jgi:hypothetical protein